MKKVYKKPMIIFESFSLSVAIAGDCGVETDAPSNGVCGYENEAGQMLFVEGITGCEFKAPDGSFNEICYHVPTEATMLFNS